jgi:hypothetical protein
MRGPCADPGFGDSFITAPGRENENGNEQKTETFTIDAMLLFARMRQSISSPHWLGVHRCHSGCIHRSHSSSVA